MDWLRGSRLGEAKRLVAQLGDPTKRERATQELIRMDADAAPTLVEALQTKDPHLLALYQQILARIPAAGPLLVKTLTTAHPILRGRVAEVFGMSKDRTAVRPLLEALEGRYFTVRARAALALGSIGAREAIPALLTALKDPEGEVRTAACLALGKFREPSTFDEITNVLLDDLTIEVRQAAAQALGNTQHPAALPYLMEALHDSFWWYEREASAGDLLFAIEKMGSPAVEPLINALQDKEGTVRKLAASLLGRVGDPRAIEPLGMALYDLHHEVAKAAAEALAQFGSSAVDVLVESLGHPESWIRIHAVEALATIRMPGITSILLGMLQDPERAVRRQVIICLGQRNDRRALPALQEIAANRADRELHLLARQALETIASA